MTQKQQTQITGYCIYTLLATFKIMERLADKTVDELKKIREDYVKKYIGDFDKPFGYKSELENLDRLIAAKG